MKPDILYIQTPGDSRSWALVLSSRDTKLVEMFKRLAWNALCDHRYNAVYRKLRAFRKDYSNHDATFELYGAEERQDLVLHAAFHFAKQLDIPIDIC